MKLRIDRRAMGVALRAHYANGHWETVLRRSRRAALVKQSRVLMHALAAYHDHIVIPRGEFQRIVMLVERARRGEISGDEFVTLLLASAEE